MSTYAKIGGNAVSATSTTLNATATANAPIGSLVVVRVAAGAGSAVAKALTDSVGNTYTLDVTETSANNTETCAIFSSVITAAIVNASTVFTVTWGSTVPNRSMDVITSTNPASGTPLDGTPVVATVTGGTTISTGSVTPATSDELAVAALYTNAAVSVTPQAGWTEDTEVATSGVFETQTLLVTSTSSIVASATTSATGRKVMALALYKLGAGSPDQNVSAGSAARADASAPPPTSNASVPVASAARADASAPAPPSLTMSVPPSSSLAPGDSFPPDYLLPTDGGAALSVAGMPAPGFTVTAAGSVSAPSATATATMSTPAVSNVVPATYAAAIASMPTPGFTFQGPAIKGYAVASDSQVGGAKASDE